MNNEVKDEYSSNKNAGGGESIKNLTKSKNFKNPKAKKLLNA